MALVVWIKRNKQKCLLSARQGTQHFCLPEHRSSVSKEHQTSSGVRMQRLRQTQQAASYRNNLQIAGQAAPILESKNSRGGICQMYSGSASGRESLGEGCHATLHLYAEGMGEFKAECRFSGQDDLFLPGVGRPHGSGTGTYCYPNEGSSAAAGETSDQGSAACSTANEGRGAFPLALEVAANGTCFHIVAVVLHRDSLEDKPEDGGAVAVPLGYGLHAFGLRLR